MQESSQQSGILGSCNPNPTKLRATWKCLDSEYKAALSHFTLSVTDSSNFSQYCNDGHETYYMEKHLESKADLVVPVVAELPEEVFMESSNKPSLTISSSTKHKREKESEIGDAIRGI